MTFEPLREIQNRARSDMNSHLPGTIPFSFSFSYSYFSITYRTVAFPYDLLPHHSRSQVTEHHDRRSDTRTQKLRSRALRNKTGRERKQSTTCCYDVPPNEVHSLLLTPSLSTIILKPSFKHPSRNSKQQQQRQRLPTIPSKSFHADSRTRQETEAAKAPQARQLRRQLVRRKTGAADLHPRALLPRARRPSFVCRESRRGVRFG